MSRTLASALRDEVTQLLAPLVGAARVPGGAAALVQSVGRTASLAEHPGLRAEILRLASLAEAIAELDDVSLTSWEGLTEVLRLVRELLTALRGIEALVSEPELATQASNLGIDLFEQLLALHLRTHHERVFRAASFLTLITPAEQAEPEPLVVESGAVTRLPRQRDRFHVDRVDDLVRDPLGTLESAYFPDGMVPAASAHQAARRLFPLLRALTGALGLASFQDLLDATPEESPPPPPPSSEEEESFGDHLDGPEPSPDEGSEEPPPQPPVDLAGFHRGFMPRFVFVLPRLLDGVPAEPRLGAAIVVSSSEHPGGARGLIVTPLGSFGWSETRGNWRLELAADAQIPAFVIGPDGVGLAPSGVPGAGATAHFLVERIAALDEPAFVLGPAKGTRLELGSLRVRTDLVLEPARQSVALGVRAGESALVIAPGDGDGFLTAVLPAGGVRVDFDLGLVLSSEHGLMLEGGAGLEMTVPVGATLGPVTVETVHIALASGAPGVQLDVACTAGVKLGPVRATIERMGLRATLAFPETDGNLGIADLSVDFAPPSGVGIAIDAQAVRGGGFLSYDRTNERYVGAVEISLLDSFDLTAIGVITTRMPDGSSGFSLLLLVSTVFATPIHLAYNFFLKGVGGLIGLDRGVNIDRLRRGLQEGAVDDILFPTDVVANMNAIVTDLAEVFPVTRDRFLVGPIAQITWNTPPLITAEIGLIIDIGNPTRIAVLGLLRAAVPTVDQPILDLKVNFLGTIDFDRGLLAFDASTYDSYIGRGSFRFTFEGDLALRVSWGQKKDFLASVGGFHPEYKPPAHLQLPSMRRVSISLLKDNPRLRLSSYFALTTNTVQFGAELDFYFGVRSFNVVGNFGFDVLFQFSPFRFVANVRARLAVRSGSTNLFSLNLDFELQGTTPWIAKGKASFRILFIKVSVKFEKTWGERREIEIPRVAVLPAVIAELERSVSWKGEMSRATGQMVQLRPEAAGAGGMLLDPGGVLTISQNLVPLGTELTRFGNAQPADVRRVDVHEVRVHGRALGLDDVQDEFAPAAFRDMSDRDKLQSAAYERRKSGVAASDSTLRTDYVLARPVRYEIAVSDATSNAGPGVVQRGQVAQPRALFEPLVPGGAIGRTAASQRHALRRQARSVLDVGAGEERFAVVSAASLRAVTEDSKHLTRAEAERRIASLVAAGHDRASLDIVPEYEMAS